MKKILLTILSCVAVFAGTCSFADIKLGEIPSTPYIANKDYVGVIDAVEYIRDNTGKKEILIITSSDNANNETALPGLAIHFNGDDLPFGLTLAGSIGQKIAVGFDANYTIGFFEIITDGYWNGTAKLSRAKKLLS